MDEEDGYDRALVNDESMAWLEDVKLMCENPESRAQSKYRSTFEYLLEKPNLTEHRIYITGKAQYDDSLFFDVQPGDDPIDPIHGTDEDASLRG